MKKYLISVDLDGTIIPNVYDISPFTIKVFNKVRELGHKIVITTGRPFRSSYFVYEAMNLDTPIINYNGQLITNPSDKTYNVKTTKLKREDIIEIYNNEKDNFTVFFVEEFDNIYTNVDLESVHLLMHHNSLSKIFEGDLNEIVKRDCHGSLFLAKDGKGQEIVDRINKKYKDIGARLWSMWEYNEIVELHSKNICKADALKIVKKELGFNKENTMILGDSINDYELFLEGSITVCPKNGDPRIKEISSIVLDEDCKSDGIAKFLIKFFDIKL